MTANRQKRLVFGVALLVALAALGTLPWNGRPMPFRASELRVLMCARQMAEGGDWLVPVYGGEARINKPPLMYWTVASVFRLAGSTDSLALARGVNGVLGVLLVAAIYGCGRVWVGRRRAWVAAAVAATSYLFLRFARLCETDVALSLFTLLTCYGVWQAARRGRGWWWWLIAGGGAATGFLFKGPAAIVLPLAALATGYATSVFRGWRRGVTGLLAMAVPFLIIVLPWYLYVLFGRSSAAAEKDIGYEMAALLKESPHHGPLVYYVYMLPALMMPWGLFLPAGVVGGWRRRRRRGVRFVIGWLAAAVVVMSLLKSKQAHYALLLLPPAALLTGSFLYEAARGVKRGGYRLTSGLLLALNALAPCAGAAAVAAPWLVEGVPWQAGLFWGLPLVVLPVAVLMWRRPSVWGRMAILGAAVVWGASGYGAVFHEAGEPAAMYRQCAAEASGRMGEQTKVFLTGRRAVPMEYYLHHAIDKAEDLAQAWRRAGAGDLVIVSLDREHRRVLTMSPPVEPVFTRRQGEFELRLYVK